MITKKDKEQEKKKKISKQISQTCETKNTCLLEETKLSFKVDSLDLFSIENIRMKYL